MNVFKRQPQVGAVYCGLRYVDIESGVSALDSKRNYPVGNINKEMLVHDVTEGTPCWIVRKTCFEQVGLFDEKLEARQDWDMFIRISQVYRIGCVPEILVEAGNHAGERVRSDPQREIRAIE